MTEPEGTRAGEPAEQASEEYREPFSRAIALCTVVTTLLAALVGLMLADSSGKASEAAGSAQTLSIRASGESVRAQRESQADFETFVLAQEQFTRSSSALQRAVFEDDNVEQRQLQVRQTLWQLQAENTEKLTPLTSTSEFGPEADPLFPARFFTSGNEEAYRLTALEDAANTLSEAWGSQAAGYTAVLTMFAVALYLFGLTLTLGRESRRLFAGVALFLVLVGFAWSAWVYLHPPHKIPDRAADEFAAGEVAYFTASSPAGYAEAADHYRDTVDLRPEFALAHARLSRAEYQAGAQNVSGYTTMTSPKALDIAVSELEKARELGLDNFEVTATLAAYYFQSGVLHNRAEDFEDSVEVAAVAAELDPDSELAQLNLAMAQFAVGDDDEARKNIEEGARGADSYLLASTMAVLTTLEEEGPEDVRGKVPAMKAFLADSAPVPVEDTPEPGEFELTDVEATPFPSSVVLSFGVEGDFDASQDLLNVFWYHRVEGQPGWSAVQEVSYYQYSRPDSQAPGTYFMQTPFLNNAIPRRCLAAGSYRVEVYAGDRLVGTAETETGFTQMDAASFADLNGAFCRPTGWEPATGELVAKPGLVHGYRSADGTEGAFMFRLAVGSSSEAGSLTADQKAAGLLDYVVQKWDLGLPATPVFSNLDESLFMGLEAGRQNYYTYEGGFVLAGAGVDEDGSVLIGIVYGPPEFFDAQPGHDGVWILDSDVPFTPLTGNG